MVCSQVISRPVIRQVRKASQSFFSLYKKVRCVKQKEDRNILSSSVKAVVLLLAADQPVDNQRLLFGADFGTKADHHIER